MESKKFKRGDIVCLKSGGPNMVVECYDSTLPITTSTNGNVSTTPIVETFNVQCQWIDASEQQHKESYHEDLLVKVSDLQSCKEGGKK
jgi:uncharacterized protein YodC (DUF2158 family)